MSLWYYTPDNRQWLGPVTSKQLRELAVSGALRPEWMVTREGAGKWVPAAKVKGLFPKRAVRPAASGSAQPAVEQKEPPARSAPVSTPVVRAVTSPVVVQVSTPGAPRFYYFKHGRRLGPFALEHIQQQVASHQLRQEDLVWVEGTPQWVAAREVPELLSVPEVIPIVQAPEPSGGVAVAVTGIRSGEKSARSAAMNPRGDAEPGCTVRSPVRSTIILSNFSFARHFQLVRWGATLQYNLLRASCAGLAVGPLLFFVPHGPFPLAAQLTAPLWWPLCYLLCLLPVLLLCFLARPPVQSSTDLSDPSSSLGMLGCLIAWFFIAFSLFLVTIGDPVVCLLKLICSRLVPVERLPLFSFQPIIFVLDASELAIAS